MHWAGHHGQLVYGFHHQRSAHGVQPHDGCHHQVAPALFQHTCYEGQIQLCHVSHGVGQCPSHDGMLVLDTMEVALQKQLLAYPSVVCRGIGSEEFVHVSAPAVVT